MKKIVMSIAAIVIWLGMACAFPALPVMADEEPLKEAIIENENEPYDGTYNPQGASYSLTYEVLTNGTIEITGIAEGGTASGDLIIPAEIEGKAVTVIGKYAFYDCKNFTGSLTIPDNVRKIDEYAFCYCTGFDGNLTLGNSLMTISDNAFFDCSGFTGDLIIPDSVTTIGNGAFDSCVYFTTLTIGNSVETIGEGAFFNADVFTGGLTIPDSVKQIGKDAFKCCNFPGELTLGSSVETIGESAFYQCGFTGDLIIPDSVTTIGEGAFYQCGFTGDLTIGNGLTTIGNTFADCKGFIGSLTIGNSVKTIDKDAFKNCKFAGRLTLGKSVETIGEGAFYNCPFTGNLTLPDGVTTIGYQAFYKCLFDGGLTLGGSVETIGDFAFQDCGFKGNLIIPDKVTMIGEQAFYRCGFDGNLTIPDSVTTIGKKAFYQCGFTGDLIIPDSVKTIDDQAFNGCGFDGSLTLPDGVTKIGDFAFFHCLNFTGNLIVPDSVTTIGNYAFDSCGFDGNLAIGKGLKTVASNAFNNCENFGGSLTIPANITIIEPNAFKDCNGFRKIINASSVSYVLPSVEGKTWKNAETGEEIPGGSIFRWGTAIRSDYYDPMDAPYFTHDPVEAQTYTGKAIKPVVKVYFGTTILEEKTDYTIAYANNTNAGMASFTVTGKGNYAGKDSDSFEIQKKKLTDADVSITEPAVAKYTKKEQTPVPKITYNGMTLKKGKDFEIAYFTDEYFREWCVPKEPGKYYVKITGIGNYEGEVMITFVIANPNRRLMSTLKADKIADKNYANGEKIRLADGELVIHDGGKPLVKGTDYVVDDDADYSDNIYPGTAKVTVHGVEEKGYTGTLTVTFKIKGTPINKATITGPADTTYDGTEQKPVPQLKYNDTPLSEGNDYELVYEKNLNAGKAKVTIKGKGGYTGSVSKTFTIKPATVTADMITIDATYPYTGSGVKPVPTVKLGETTLREGKDYTVKYANNSAVTGTTTKQPTITVTGKGNFTGKADKTFTITAANINTCKVAVDDVIYKDKNGNWKPKKVTVIGTDGKALKAGKDYDDKNIRFTSDEEGEHPIEPDAKLDANTLIYVWADAKGTNYTGTVKGIYRIVKRDISKLTATLDPKAYTGKAVELNKGDIKWKSGRNVVNDVTFDIIESSYTNNVNKGKATVVVKGTGNYGGTKTITFTIGTKGILWWWRNLFN